jgi:universal stress protein E
VEKEVEGSSYQETLEKSVRTELDKLGMVLKESGDYAVQIRMAYGNISEKILDVAEDEDANVIFLNRGTASELAGRTLGLNSLKVARLSQKPVAIISNRPAADKPHIVVPVDFSEPSKLALNAAILHARKIKAKLTVITVFEPIRITSSRLMKAGVDETIENKVLYREMETRLTEYLQEFDFTGMDLHKEVLKGVAYEEILWYSHMASIVYMGSTGKSGLRRALLGSVSEKVIQEFEELFKLRIISKEEMIWRSWDTMRKPNCSITCV